MAVATIPAPAQAALLLFHRGEETRCHCSGGRQQQVPTPVALPQQRACRLLATSVPMGLFPTDQGRASPLWSAKHTEKTGDSAPSSFCPGPASCRLQAEAPRRGG